MRDDTSSNAITHRMEIPMNVKQYLEKDFPNPRYGHGDEQALESMPLDSNCGSDCKKAIDAARKMRRSIEMAYGDDRPDYIIQLRDMTIDVCRIFITG
jgi:hypothetical protein